MSARVPARTSRSGQPDGGGIRDFTDLKAWQAARLLAKQVYEATRAFPREELYGLVLQMRRAAVSIASNIAEGYGRGSLGDYLRFLHTSRGSLGELRTQIILAQDLGYLAPDAGASVLSQAGVCFALLHGLIRALCARRDAE